ncbi:MAG TPA: EAL domain-containing protein [Steroidobacteraceae bacterium]|nr:EAL domain-containing protein [Steroidobacteraceae bacterium]
MPSLSTQHPSGLSRRRRITWPLLFDASVPAALALASIWTACALRAYVHGAGGFAEILGQLSREAARLLAVVVALCSAWLVVAGIAIARAYHRRSERLTRELQHAATREREYAQQLTYQATHDALTGLANRAQFEVRLAAALEECRGTGRAHVLLYLDLDQFKVVNDTCGHAGGDELIKQVAWVMRARMREGDVLARLGGDEFGALLPLCSEQDGLAFAERIRSELAEQRFRWDDRLFSVHASIGVLVLGEEPSTAGEALAAVDQACYVAKDNGRNRVQLYRTDDRQVQSRRGEMRWVERIGAALDQGRFVLVAQEVRALSARARRRGGRRFELLLRMVDPDGRLVAPMGFIPAAERYGLMPRIDRWVIARACRGLATLRPQDGALPTCMINLSGTSVSDPSLAPYIAECLADNGLSGANVGFELTETAAIGNIVSASELMAQLRALGCLIALDDFGSGMASFAYLKSLPIDLLKVDGSFIRDVRVDLVNLAMVEAVQRIGDVMGLQTVAEGVDNEGILATLAAIGVDHAQGYHIAQPVPLEQMLDPAAPLATPRSGALVAAGA